MYTKSEMGEGDAKKMSSSHARDMYTDVLFLALGLMLLTLAILLGFIIPLVVVIGLSALLAGERWARHLKRLTGNAI
jgi:hypothetical protein